MQQRQTTVGRPLFIICSIFMLVLAACGGNPAATNIPASGTAPKAPADQQVYVYAQQGVRDIATFDPALSTDAASINAIDQVFTGLVQFNDQLQIVDQVAASHELGADGLTWTFKIKPDLKFSDGTPLTSKDVAYSIDRALKPSLKSTVAPTYLNLIKDYDKRFNGKIPTIIGDSLLTPDPQTIEIVTTKKAAYFLDALAYSCSFVVEQSLVDKYGDGKWTDHLNEGGGDGPWRVEQYQHNNFIELVPNPNFYGPVPQLTKEIIAFYADQQTGYQAYQAGQVSYALVPPTNIAQVKALPENQMHLVPQLYINLYYMNFLIKPFDNVKIRQAFALSVNKDLITHTVYKDANIPTDHIVPQGMPGYNQSLIGPAGVKSTQGDPTMAKQLFQEGLQEEGMTLSTLPPIVLTYSPTIQAGLPDEVAALQQMWHNTLGVTVTLRAEDTDKLLADAPNSANNPQGLMMWQLGWIADYPDPQDWLSLQFGNGAPYNETNYGQNHSADAAQQQAVQQLMNQADINADQQARLQGYNQAEQQLVNDVAWLPMYQVAFPVARKPCVVGVVDNALQLPLPNDWGRVYISTDSICSNASRYQ